MMLNMAAMQAVEKLRAAMASASMEQLHRQTGIAVRSLYSYRNGEVVPPMGRADVICNALGLEFRIEPIAGKKAVFGGRESRVSEVRDDGGRAGGAGELASLMARIRRHWDALGNDYARTNWVRHLQRSFPELGNLG